jgi:TRAP-type mannitol/chloroaromatic compound transport system substrate-binding protein
MQELGAAVTILAGGEIVPALERGVIDGAEFNNPTSDSLLGFQDVSKNYMLQSWHQSAEAFEIIFNKAKFDALPAELKAIVKYAAESSSSDMLWKATDRYSKSLEELRAKGVQIVRTPDSVLNAQLAAWKTVNEKLSATNPIYKKTIESQMAWVKRTGAYEAANTPPFRTAYDFFFKA